MPGKHIVSGTRPVMGIGSCLAGNAVRYDNRTKSPTQHVLNIARSFEMRAFCPEMGIGMGVPRAPIQLVGSSNSVRALDVQGHTKDYTESLAAYAGTVLSQTPELCGYILVKGSPSCGYTQVKRFADNGDHVASDQQGIFAAALSRANPLLPLEDDVRLNDPGLRDSFVTRAYIYHDWKLLCSEGLDAPKLLEFYCRYKGLVKVLDFSPDQLPGRLPVGEENPSIQALSANLIANLMSALTQH